MRECEEISDKLVLIELDTDARIMTSGRAPRARLFAQNLLAPGPQPKHPGNVKLE